MNLREAPFIRLCIPLILGVCIYQFEILKILESNLLLIALFFFILIIDVSLQGFSILIPKGFLINIFIVLIGLNLAALNDSKRNVQKFSSVLNKPCKIAGEIVSQVEKKKQINFALKVNDISTSESIKECSDLKIYVRWKKEESNVNLQKGDHVELSGKLREFEEIKNPKSFDFKKFYTNQGIHHQINCYDLKVLKRNDNPFSVFIQKARRDFVEILKSRISGEDELAVANALILGQKSGLSRETKSSYADTGTMHILAVSGLHVGVLSMFLMFIFSLYESHNFAAKIIKTAILLSTLWIYTFIAGASPSVLRASCMFSFIIVGNGMHRSSNIYNTLAISAFLLTLCNPKIIFTVSFQLSYIALLGIIYFQKKIYALWIPINGLINWMWKLVTVSIAAQISTFALSIFYFNQMPLYFWLTGLFAVPMALVILGLGFILILSHYLIPLVESSLGFIISNCLKLNNAFISLVDKIPGKKISYLYFDFTDLCMLYSTIIFGVLAAELKSKLLFKVSFIILLGLFFKMNFNLHTIRNTSGFIVYKTNNASLIDFFKGHDFYSIQSAEIKKDKIDFASKGFRASKKISKHKLIDQSVVSPIHWANSNLVHFQNKTLLFHNQMFTYDTNTKFKVDFLVIQECSVREINKLLEDIKFDVLILDGSNTWKYNDKLGIELKTRNIKHHDVLKNGAFLFEEEH